MDENVPFVTDALEFYANTPEGLPLWKTKGLQLTYENLLENVFILSTDIAKYFEIRHYDLVNNNFRKLLSEKYIKHERNFSFMLNIAHSAQREHIVYAFTTSETEFLIMDFSGPKARKKKLEILQRLQSIEADVLKGSFDQARQKASMWDGVKLLKEFGFTCSLPNNIATKKDIVAFLKVPESTLNNFLRKQGSEIKPISLDRVAIKNLGLNAPRLYGYSMEDVSKIVMGMDTAIGIEIKQKMFGNVSRFVNLQPKDETQWHNAFLRTFDSLDLHHNYPIDQYRVDFFVQDLMLALECNGYGHRYYNQEEEAKREDVITKKYGYKLVRFHHKASWQALMNAVLKVKLGETIRVYETADLVK
jgi:very-short-patch-repair endonuclease/phage regulator Rha-like protein